MRPSHEIVAPVAIDEDRGFKVRGLRWWMVGLVFLATVINYIDRQTINVLSPVILKDLGLTETQFSRITSAFLGAYTIGMAVWGRLFDRFGTRLAFTAAIILWSIAAGLHTLAIGFLSLAAFRFLLGFGEAGNWPGAAKTVAEWFPSKERALGMAIFNSGAALGGVIAPPVIGLLAAAYGWKLTFLLTASLGAVWLVLWLAFFRSPDKHPWLTNRERAHIRDNEAPVAGPPVRLRFAQLLRYRQVWAIMGARFFTDPIWWLYLTWLPLYLNKAHGFDIKKIGMFAWMPYLAADLGALAGGFVSGRLIGRGYSVDKARRICLVIGACLMPVGALAARVQNPMVALALIGVVLFAFQFWMNNVQSLPGDFFPSSAVGGVFGMGGTAAGLASMMFVFLSGPVVERLGYAPMFMLAGALAPIGLFLVLLLAGPIRRIPLNQEISR